jgi:cytochrome c peroxidase
MGIADFQANRSPDKRYRTTPLKGLFAHQKGGFFHDGRFPTLGDVVSHYDRHLSLGLTEAQSQHLVEYLQVALTPGAQEADDEAKRERR